MARSNVADLAARLGADAEAVCRAYLSAGRRVGRYWIVGDARNAAGRSMFVRLVGPARGPGAAGKWCDAATGEHGDLLDVIREAHGLAGIRECAEEARRFLGLPREPAPVGQTRDRPASFVDSARAARRLFAACRPIAGTLAETYLRRRGVPVSHDLEALRFSSMLWVSGQRACGGVVQDDGDHRCLQRRRTLDGQIDRGWGFGFDPIAEAAKCAVDFQRGADAGDQGVKGRGSAIRGLNNHLQLGPVLVMVA